MALIADNERGSIFRSSAGRNWEVRRQPKSEALRAKPRIPSGHSAAYPHLTADDVEKALCYAAASLSTMGFLRSNVRRTIGRRLTIPPLSTAGEGRMLMLSNECKICQNGLPPGYGMNDKAVHLLARAGGHLHFEALGFNPVKTWTHSHSNKIAKTNRPRRKRRIRGWG
ncbi:MAG: hypothetical protein JO250_11520 [Armatimonadetes bacterium]|nr:hypothetical protein [Armatimonadota bacterium]